MKTSVEILMDHALETLPDSLAMRKTVLRAITHVMHGKHPSYKTALAMLGSLQRHEEQQAKLLLRTIDKPKRRKSVNHDGDGQSNGEDGKAGAK
jgi:hypothetical protein